VILGREARILRWRTGNLRHHCLLEVRDTYINLKDMDSTNGTFFDEERVRAAVLQEGAQFRIGGSVIRVNFRPK